MDEPESWDDEQVEQFVRSHIWGAVEANREWLEGDDEPESPRVEHGAELVELVSDAMRDQLEREVREFAAAHMPDLCKWLNPDHAGYDLWMTRTREGVGFWARYLPDDPAEVFSGWALTVRRDPEHVARFDTAMKRLTDAAHELTEPDVYVGDDGRIHI